MSATRFTVESDTHTDVIDITDRVRDVIPKRRRVCTVFSEHTTTGVCVNESESRLLGDIESMLAEAVPDDGWDHDELDGNADSHLRALLVGKRVDSRPRRGPRPGAWQSVLFVDCDGPRERAVDESSPTESEFR
ncbi:hypothetical protein C9J85_05540 [Haloferax sp. wsp5]|nr:hypothetical protein C9J85_05540 [Haloferax sp. wsp5]